MAATGFTERYDVVGFSVDTAGSYGFSLVALDSGDDTELFLYQDSLDAAQPFANLPIANDDSGGVNSTNSGFGYGLVTGTTYFAVVTGFCN